MPLRPPLVSVCYTTQLAILAWPAGDPRRTLIGTNQCAEHIGVYSRNSRILHRRGKTWADINLIISEIGCRDYKIDSRSLSSTLFILCLESTSAQITILTSLSERI